MLPDKFATAWTWPAASPASKIYVHQPEKHYVGNSAHTIPIWIAKVVNVAVPAGDIQEPGGQINNPPKSNQLLISGMAVNAAVPIVRIGFN